MPPTNDKNGTDCNFLDSVLNGFSDSVFVIDRDYRILESNNKGKERFHLTPQDFSKKHCYEVSHHRDSPCNNEEHPCPLTMVFQTGKPFVTEHIHHDGDGNEIVVSINAIPLFDDEGKVTSIVEFSQDITKQRRTEARLQAEKAQAQQYLDIAGVMIIAFDAQQNVTMINRMGCEILGYKAEELIDKNFFDRIVPEVNRETIRQVYIQVLAGEREPVRNFQSEVLTKSGEKRLIDWHNTLLKDSNGKIIGALTSGRDITEQHQALEAIERGKKQWENTFDTVPDQIMVVDRNGFIERVNRSCAKYFGWSLKR